MTDRGDKVLFVPRYKRRNIEETQENNSQQNTNNKQLNEQNKK